MSDMLIALSTNEDISVSQVGGKAASLIRLQRSGFNVPAGVVLTADFFDRWLKAIEASDEWQVVIDRMQNFGTVQLNRQKRARLTDACERVKTLVSNLTFDDRQFRNLRQIESDLGAGPFAVRSSSPEEDLAGASFAGLYETVLNVSGADIERAIRACFRSCLDSRVLLYKFKMNFASLAPMIAVVVQRLLESDISGVAFSLNPLTNDFDELLINASWGLGESLVSGDITPDTIVIDKVTGDVIEHRAGDKGGDRPDEKCLTDNQIDELAAAVKEIEKLYAEPIDVEWALAAGQLYILQARPVTTYVPLHPSLQTKPGDERHLYMDGYLTDGVTMSVATTPMSDDILDLLARLMAQWASGIPAQEIEFALAGIHMDTGRSYFNLSWYMHLMGKGEALARQAKKMNPMMAAVFTSPDIERYRPVKPPEQLGKAQLLRRAFGILWRTRRAIFVLFRPAFNKDRFDADYSRLLEEFDQYIRRPLEYSKPLTESLTEDLLCAGSTTMVSTYPAFLYFYLMTERIKRLVGQDSAEQAALVDVVLGGYENDMIVNMGLMLFDLSSLLPATEFEDIDALARKIEQRSLPDSFMQHWDDFVYRFGCRGPLEMELANAKYGESPILALQQIAGLAAAGGEFNPHDMQSKKVEQREQAYQQLLAILSPRKAKKLKKAYAACLRYAASREYFKHYIMQIYERARKLLLHHADKFVEAGRMQQRDHIFELTLADVDQAVADNDFDIRTAVQERGAFSRKLRAHVRHFPMCIDSRGRILRPQPKVLEGEEGAIVGAAVSPGVARGPIKVLNDPFEKEVEPGDILVAVTTDPGWTPLFINAAAVILEIGGELQHGALVAREYGKPCVSGIQDVTTRFADGQIVEVDGDAGVVRPVDADIPPGQKA